VKAFLLRWYFTLSAIHIVLWVGSATAAPRQPWLVSQPTGRSLNGIAFGGGKFVAVGQSGIVLTSTDGANWIQRVPGTNNLDLYAVTYGTNGFVAVGGTRVSSSQPVIWTSPDGIAWTFIDTTPLNLQNGNWLQGVTFGGGLYVAVGGNYTTNTVSTSSNGVDWTLRETHLSNTGNYPLRSIAWGNGLYVAGGKWLLTSPDAMVWTQQPSPPLFYELYATTFANGQFVGVGPYTCMTSTNGTNWTAGSPTTFHYLYGVTYGDGFFVYVGDGYPAHSMNGTNWTTHTNLAPGAAIAFGNSVFVAVSGGSIYRTAANIQFNLTRDTAARLALTTLVPGKCRIEITINPADSNLWSTLTNLPVILSPTNWIDRTSTNVPLRFYRATWSP
jgi:hypothetical protein